jgi:hypothetical protein
MAAENGVFLVVIDSTLLLVFSAPPINRVYKITHFQFQVGLMNKNIEDLSWFRPLLRR